MFGAVNALFSGLAFVGLIITLVQQKEELKLQREELAQTRDEMVNQRQEMENQRKEFEEQNKSIRYQRFENSFFNMLTSFRDLRQTLHFKAVDGAETYVIEVEGINMFRVFYEDKVAIWSGKNADIVYGLKGLIGHRGYKSYREMDCIEVFEHYFKFLYQTILFVDTSDLIDDDRRGGYMNILRDHLSSYELVFLFYYAVAPYNQDMRFVMQKYPFFENLDLSLLAEESHIKLYERKIYGNLLDIKVARENGSFDDYV